MGLAAVGWAAAMLFGVIGCAHGQARQPTESGSVTPEIRAQLTPRQFTTLSSELAARIDRIAAQVGERFKAGDTLVEFDCALQKAQLARTRAVMVQAEKTYAINLRLQQLKSIGQLELDVSGAEVQKAKADVTAAQATVSKCSIEAPFSGVTAEQKAREFQYATPGQPLLEIVDDRQLEVELIAPSRWIAWLKPGTTFDIYVDETGRTHRAQIDRLGGRVDPVSQSIKVIGHVTDNSDGLLPGMSGRALLAPPN